MPLRKRLVWDNAPVDELSPAAVTIILDSGEELLCAVQPSWTDGVFHITLRLSSPIPKAIERLGREGKPERHHPVNLCPNQGGITHLDAGDPLVANYLTVGLNTKTVTLGTIVDFRVSDRNNR